MLIIRQSFFMFMRAGFLGSFGVAGCSLAGTAAAGGDSFCDDCCCCSCWGVCGADDRGLANDVVGVDVVTLGALISAPATPIDVIGVITGFAGGATPGRRAPATEMDFRVAGVGG